MRLSPLLLLPLLLTAACDDGVRSLAEVRESDTGAVLWRWDGEVSLVLFLVGPPRPLDRPRPEHCARLAEDATLEVSGATVQSFERGGLVDSYCSPTRLHLVDAGREVGITFRDATGTVSIALPSTPEVMVVPPTGVRRGESLLVDVVGMPEALVDPQLTFRLRAPGADMDGPFLSPGSSSVGSLSVAVPSVLTAEWTGPALLAVTYEAHPTCDGVSCVAMPVSLAVGEVEVLP